MKYGTIGDWLKSGSCNTYDFVEDTQSGKFEDYGKLQEDAYVKFFIYKFNNSSAEPSWNVLQRGECKKFREDFLTNQKEFLKLAKDYEDIKDPDGSSVLLQAVYQTLWPDLMKNPFMTYEARIPRKRETVTRLYSDTMTSAMTRFTDAMKQLIPGRITEEEKEAAEKISCIYSACDGYLKERSKGSGQKWWSGNFSVMVIACLSDDDRKKLFHLIESKYPGEEPDDKSPLPRLLNICHTIGNYCPVPKKFNGARSEWGEYDYWDLTLMKIREWYLTADKLSIYERDQLLSRDLLHDKGDALGCMRWLECFGPGEKGWHNFVDTLLMQDYVYNEDDGIDQDNEKYYDVKPFWSKHGWKVFWSKDGWKEDENRIIGMPENTEEINQGLKEICSRIEARSKRIIDALQKNDVYGWENAGIQRQCDERR